MDDGIGDYLSDRCNVFLMPNECFEHAYRKGHENQIFIQLYLLLGCSVDSSLKIIYDLIYIILIKNYSKNIYLIFHFLYILFNNFFKFSYFILII